MTKKRNFDSFTFDEIEYLFSIKRLKNHTTLSNWLNAKQDIPVKVKEQIEFLQTSLIEYAEAWNEDELKLFFIGPLLVQAELYNETFKPFTQRNLKAAFPEKNLEIQGKVEFMLAQGKVNPREPFFFLHEYKQERRRETDPLAQVLIAMLAARQHNQHDFPDYGCYVVGRFWYFIVFDGSEYAVSSYFDATKDDIFDIFNIICAIKKIAKQIFNP
jgi:hypothetical protein